MSIVSKLSIVLALSTSVIGASQQVNQAIQLSDGTVYFATPPRLVNTRTSERSPYVPATYYFTLNLPATAGEPLGRVSFTQQPAPEDLEFNLERSYAEALSTLESKQKLTTSVTSDSKTNTVSVRFDPPVPPGHTVRIGLRSVKNPHFGGVYLLRVTAYPAGEKVHGQFLGFGRLQFDLPGGRS